MLYSIGVNLGHIDKIETSVLYVLALTNSGPLLKVIAEGYTAFQVTGPIYNFYANEAAFSTPKRLDLQLLHIFQSISLELHCKFTGATLFKLRYATGSWNPFSRTRGTNTTFPSVHHSTTSPTSITSNSTSRYRRLISMSSLYIS
jgi:hypothetical protein